MEDFELAAALREQLAMLRVLTAEVAPYRASSDAILLEISTMLGEAQRIVGAHRALVAGEIARRSTAEHGYHGLARRAGHRTVEEFLRAHTGSTIREAKTAIQAGEAIHGSVELPDARTGEVAEPSAPWMRPVAAAVADGLLGVEHIAAIRRGLGTPCARVTAEHLEQAAAQLCDDVRDDHGRVTDADRLYRRARNLRDELDEEGIADRERHRIAQRSLRIVPQADGMTRLVWLLDPESAGYVAELYNRATSPKRGGPRFVDPTRQRAAAAIELDPRTPEQLASDVFLDLLRAGTAVDAAQLLGSEGAAVQLVAVRDQLDTADGHGWIVGQSDPVSRATVERHICSDGHQTITVDPQGNPLDVGRTQRLHTKKQRIALAIRDGGCCFGDCERIVGMVEVHHIDHWHRDRGGTSVDRGILLCRYHHLRVHNEGWEIERRDGRFVLIPPSGVDPSRTPIPLRSKSPIARDLERRRTG